MAGVIMPRKKVYEFLPEHACAAGCGKMIPEPMKYCSSKCRDKMRPKKELQVIEEKNVGNAKEILRLKF